MRTFFYLSEQETQSQVKFSPFSLFFGLISRFGIKGILTIQFPAPFFEI
jgi:hypothetical protein